MTNQIITENVVPFVACPKCGDRTRLYGVEPHVRLDHTEVHTYVCDSCNAIEAVVVPLAAQSNGGVEAAAQQ